MQQQMIIFYWKELRSHQFSESKQQIADTAKSEKIFTHTVYKRRQYRFAGSSR